jgi:hypothetical protein
MMDWKVFKRSGLVLILKYHPGTSLEELKKTKKDLRIAGLRAEIC